MKNALGMALLVIALGVTSSAQDHRWTFDAGAGFSPLLGDLNNYLRNGWNITAGGGYNFNPGFSTTVEYMFNDFGISQRVLDSVGARGGSAHLWSVTVDPRLTLRYVGKVRPFVVAGVGYYRLTKSALVPVSAADPFFSSIGGPGGSLGLGFDFGIRDTGLKLFTEARYHYAATGSVTVHMIPLTVGLRW